MLLWTSIFIFTHNRCLQVPHGNLRLVYLHKSKGLVIRQTIKIILFSRQFPQKQLACFFNTMQCSSQPLFFLQCFCFRALKFAFQDIVKQTVKSQSKHVCNIVILCTGADCCHFRGYILGTRIEHQAELSLILIFMYVWLIYILLCCQNTPQKTATSRRWTFSGQSVTLIYFALCWLYVSHGHDSSVCFFIK